MRILLVEDEKYMAEAVADVLEAHHYTVDLAFDGEYGLDCALSGIYDIIMLDIMLPKADGLTVLKKLRAGGVKIPVILLTARDKMSDKVSGLDSGADDYLAKPFHTEELLARIRALGRRMPELNNSGIVTLGDLSFNPAALTLFRDNTEVKLTLKEAQLLELLSKRSGMVFSSEIIIEKLWGYESETEDRHVVNQVFLLRKKLEQISSAVTVHTVRGAGYLLEISGGTNEDIQ